MTRLLFIGEGRGDIGREGSTERDEPYPGDLVGITERILEERTKRPVAGRIGREIRYWTEMRTRGAGRRKKEQPRGFAAKLEMFLVHHSDSRDVDGVVAVVDGRAREAADRLEQLQKGREAAREQAAPLSLRCAVGVAIQEIEAWLLADEDARRHGFGSSIGGRALDADPEVIDDPKSVFKRNEDAFLEMQEPGFEPWRIRMAMVEGLRVDEVARRCPRGFAPFRREVDIHLGPLFEAAAAGRTRKE